MLIPSAAPEHPAARLARAAWQADCRGKPEDLALLQLMTADLHKRLSVRPPPAPTPDVPQRRRLARAAVASAPIDAPALPSDVAPTSERYPPYNKRLACALADITHGRPMQAAALAHDVALADLRQSQILLRTQGLKPLLTWLGYPS